MLEIKEVTEELVPLAREFLSRQAEFGYSDKWDPLFRYDWKLKQFPYGYALLDCGNMVGFLGTIFSERNIKNKTGVVCCLSTWVVDINCKRGSGRSLLNPLLAMNNVSIVGVTPNHRSGPALQKLDFEILDHKQIVVSVFPNWVMSLVYKKKNLFITVNKDEIANQVQENDKKILEDHKNLNCLHFLIQVKLSGRYCYGVGTSSVLGKKYLLRLKCLNLCYLSDADFFVKNINHASKCFHSIKYDLIRYDARLIQQRLSFLEYKIPRLRVFKSTQFEKWELDNLYTELVTWNRY